jgi:hypothetical protein
MSLIELVAEYMKSERLRRRYALSPKKVLAEYGVPAALLKVLQREGLSAALGAEVAGLGRDGKIYPLGWGIPAMTITGFSPDTADVGVEFELTIEGEEFSRDVKAALLSDHADEGLIEASKTVFKSANRIIGTFKLRQSGSYEVAAFIPAKTGGPPRRGTWFDQGATLDVSDVDRARKPTKKKAKARKR